MQPHLGMVQPQVGAWLASVQPEPQARTARVQPERSPSPHRAQASVGITMVTAKPLVGSDMENFELQ